MIYSVTVHSQILDDSTKQVYGPHTTKYVTEDDIYNNTGRIYNIDSTLNDFHNYDFVYKGRLLYQNLGNLGTPLNNIYYTPPQTIGRNLGFNSFDPYAYNPYRIKYYDTRSPYTSVYYVQGATGQQIGEAVFSRNIKPNWNFGFNIRRMTTNKLIGAKRLKDRLTDHTAIAFFTRYFTKDSVYQVLFNYTYLDHKNYETGGVKRDSAAETNNTFFDYRGENVNLNASRSFEKRSAFHLYQQLSLPRSQGIQLFHIFDYYSQINRFNSNLVYDSLFYPNNKFVLPALFIPSATIDRTDYRLIENKVGVKGYLNGFYYRGYFRRKDFYYKQYYPTDSIRWFNENFVGGSLAYDFTPKSRLNANVEYLITGNELNPGLKDYLIKAEYVSDYIKGGVYRINHSPTLLQMKYYGNNLFWNHLDTFRFTNTTSDNAYLNGNIRWKYFTISPGINYSSVKNYIYYDTLAEPTQFKGPAIQILSLDLLLRFNWKWMNVENYIKYTNVSNSAIIKIPQIYNHSRIYYQNMLFKKALLAQLGVDLFWKSSYYGNYYMPITQQFYLNDNTFLINSYLQADVFLNVQIKKVNIFVKLSNFNQGFVSNGYFSTPYYPGLPRNFEFGIKWMFFD